MFLIPAMVSYAIHLNPGVEFYIISFIGLLLFPIIPIIVSCVIGTFITYISSKFKGKNIIQTLLTVIVLLGIMYFSYNFNGFITNIADKAVSINEIITRIYYPAGAFVELITSYSSLKLLEFVFINLVLFFVIIAILGKFYFKTNSGLKSVRTANDNKNIKIKSHSPIGALIKKELSRFINSPVFVSNAGFGLILFIIGCILIAVKFEEIAQSVVQSELSIQIDYIKSLMPLLLFGFICMSSFMTSITSSMISLEGKSLNILKSLPVKPYTIIKAKIITAIIIMIPFIIIGDIIIFVRFSFDILSMILILLTSIILPLLSETFGIIINLKYPRMDAKNDTEVVKQSMSSTICVFTGIGMVILNVFLIAMAIQANISNYLTILVLLFVYSMICMGLLALLNKNSEKDFNNISV